MAVGFGLGVVVEVGIVFELGIESGFGFGFGSGFEIAAAVVAGFEAEEVDLLNGKTLH